MKVVSVLLYLLACCRVGRCEEFTPSSNSESPVSANVHDLIKERMNDSSHGPADKPFFWDAMRAVATKVVDGSYGTVSRLVVQANISSSCSLAMFQYLRGIRNLEPWAFRLFDASGKYPTGMLQGTQADIGAYDECIETVIRDDFGRERVRGQYCNVHAVSRPNDTSMADGILEVAMISHRRVAEGIKFADHEKVAGIRLGLCVPADCSKDDMQELANALVQGIFKVNVLYCVTNEPLPINKLQIGVIVYLTLLAMIMVLGTSLHLYLSCQQNRKSKPGPWTQSLLAFSVIANHKLLFAPAKDAEAVTFRFLHGLRFLSIFWVALGHAYIPLDMIVARPLNALHYADKWDFCIITAGYLSVDTFFFLSGFLLAFNVLKERRSSLVIAFVGTLHRYIRVTIPLCFAIICFFLMPLIASGPNSPIMYYQFFYEIMNHWWAILLQIKNLVGEPEIGVFLHTWYLSADFQLFLVSIAVLVLFRRKPMWGFVVFLLLSILGCSVTAWQLNNTQYEPFLLVLGESFLAHADTFRKMYILPTYHAACFFTGCIVAILLKKYGETKPSKVALLTLWVTSLTCGMLCIFIRYDWNRGARPAGRWTKVAIGFWDRILWSVFLAWITYACATKRGGWLCRFLSWEAFVPFSRLTFGMYLVHFPLYLVLYHISRERIYFSHMSFIIRCFGVVVFSFFLSYILFLACEAPTGRLEKILLMPLRQNTEVQSNGKKLHEKDAVFCVDSCHSSNNPKLNLKFGVGKAANTDGKNFQSPFSHL